MLSKRMKAFWVSTLMCASAFGVVQDEREIQALRAENHAIFAAAAAGDLELVSRYIKNVPRVVVMKNASGQTAVQLATANLHTKVVEKLLTSGAQLDEKSGWPLIHLALKGRDKASNDADARLEMVRMLIKYGASVRTTDVLRKSPLHVAVRNGHYKVLADLMVAGADIMARDGWGMTPLHDAALYNQIAMIDWLVTNGAQVQAGDLRKETPLHAAVRRFRSKAAKRLLTHGARVDSKNTVGQTPLHLTGLAGPDEPEIDLLMKAVAEVLIDAGADVNAVDKAGHTPLHYVLNKKRKKLEELIRSRGGKSLAVTVKQP